MERDFKRKDGYDDPAPDHRTGFEMGLLDSVKDNLKDFDFSKLDASKIEEVKKLVAGAADKVDVAGIAKKVGISEDAVEKVLATLKK